MRKPGQKYDLNGIPPEALIEIYNIELSNLESLYPDVDHTFLCDALDKIFNNKYLKGNKWKIINHPKLP
jgi:hypothetical protein